MEQENLEIFGKWHTHTFQDIELIWLLPYIREVVNLFNSHRVKALVSEASKFVASRLRQLRKQAALSQEQAADWVGISFKYYQHLESGRVLGMRLSTAEQITTAYGIDLAAFFSKKEPKIRPPNVPPPPHRKRKSST